MREEVHALDQLDPCFVAALDAESEHRSRTLWQVFSGELVKWALLQSGVGDPGHARVVGEKFGDLQRIIDMAVHAQMQGLDAGQSQKCIQRRQGQAEIATRERARIGGKNEVAKNLVEFE